MLEIFNFSVWAKPESCKCMIQFTATITSEVTLTKLPIKLHILSLLKFLINIRGTKRARDTTIEAIFESHRNPSVILQKEL